MSGIKTTLTFLFGAFYASCIWLVCTLKNDYIVIPGALLLITTVIIVVSGIFWLTEHWND